MRCADTLLYSELASESVVILLELGVRPEPDLRLAPFPLPKPNIFRDGPPDQYLFQPELRRVSPSFSVPTPLPVSVRVRGSAVFAANATPLSSLVSKGGGREGSLSDVTGSDIWGIGLLMVLLKALFRMLLVELRFVWSLGLRFRLADC
jgi:hypothetical protein